MAILHIRHGRLTRDVDSMSVKQELFVVVTWELSGWPAGPLPKANDVLCVQTKDGRDGPLRLTVVRSWRYGGKVLVEGRRKLSDFRESTR